MEIEVKKDSAYWNKQAGLEKSEWLAENVKGLDHSVKEVLRLIDHDGDFTTTTENGGGDHLKQPELIARVRDISHRHQLLADRYNKLTGENGSLQSENGMKSYEKAAFLTPDKKLGLLKTVNVIVGSDVSPSPGGRISDSTPNEGSESSLLLTDSDSESYNSSPNEHSSSHSEMEGLVTRGEQQHQHDAKKGGCGECEMLLRRDYEKELKASAEKLQFAEEEIAKLKSELQNNEEVMFSLGSLEAQLMSAMNQITLLESEIEQENKRSLVLQRHIVDLEGKLESAQLHVLELQGSLTNCTAEVSDRDLEIGKLNAELQDVSGNFALEKWQLESSVSNLSQSLVFHETRTKELLVQCDSLTDEIKKYEAGKIEIEEKQEALRISWQDDIEQMKSELGKKNAQVDALNETLGELKLKYDMLMVEKDGVNAKLQTANADLSARADRIEHLEQTLHELHSENKRLSGGHDHANKLIDELKSRIDELEKEVGVQATKTNNVAEEKREVIRQLCFSLDYFKSAYEEVRNAYAPRRHTTTVAS